MAPFFALLVLLASGAELERQSSPTTPQVTAAATPMYPNPSCPIMGKPVSTKLFAETEMGRIYICCKGCVKDILEDVSTAYRTAYPTDKRVENKICPVTGGEITKDSPTVVLQGFQFFVHRDADVQSARENSQIVLAKLHDPKLVDLENKSCPVTGEATASNTFVVIDSVIVRLSSTKVVEEVAKDPPKTLTRAKQIRAEEGKKESASKVPGKEKNP